MTDLPQELLEIRTFRVSDVITALFCDELDGYADEILFEICVIPQQMPSPNGAPVVIISAAIGMYMKAPVVGQDRWFFTYGQHADLMTLKNADQVRQIVMNGVMELRRLKADYLAGK